METIIAREESENTREQQPIGHQGQRRRRMRWSRPEDRDSPAVCDAENSEAIAPL